MKKVIIFLCMTVGLLSCTSENFTPEEETTVSVPMQFDIKVADNTETKAAKTNWASGDIIYVFFNGLATKYLILEYNGSTWSNTSGGGTLETSDFENLNTKTLTAVHFPVAVDVAYADNQFSFTKDSKPVYNYYLFQAGKTYEVSGTTVSATLSMGKPEGMAQFHVAGIKSSVANYTFGCSKVKPVACKSVGTNGKITEDVLQAGARLSGIADADGGIFAGRLTTTGSADYKFTLASDDYIYTLTRTSRTLTAGKMYNFPALTGTGDSNWSVTAASDLYVDLGITVGNKKVYWAKYNLGATTETDYGDYFAWGEITGYNNYKYNNGSTKFSWSNYRWGYTNTTLTKYCSDAHFGKNGFTDGLMTLQPEDDAAYAALGGKFRMPTSSEIDALLALNKEWVSNYNNTGISGYKFTGNGNTLFLPAVGKPYDDNPNEDGSAGNKGFYWSSSLYIYGGYNSADMAWSLHFHKDSSVEKIERQGGSRYSGFSIRPVSD